MKSEMRGSCSNILSFLNSISLLNDHFHNSIIDFYNIHSCFCRDSFRINDSKPSATYINQGYFFTAIQALNFNFPR